MNVFLRRFFPLATVIGIGAMIRSDSSPQEARPVDEVWTEDTTYQEACGQRPFVPVPPLFPRLWPYPRAFVSLLRDQFAVENPPRGIPLKDSMPGTWPNSWDWGDGGRWEQDRRHFWNMLVSTVPLMGWEVSRIREDPPVKILDVGCGLAVDAMPLQSYFGGVPYGVRGGRASYLGIDIDPTAIEFASVMNEYRTGLNFLTADATRFDDYPQLRGEFDVIVIRHPEVASGPGKTASPVWIKIFGQSLLHLAPHGLLIVTTYQCGEHLMVESIMRWLEVHQSLSVRNLFSGINSHDPNPTVNLRRQDRYVSVYRVD